MGATRRRILCTSAGVLSLGLWGCSGPEAAGKANAERDLAAGVLRLKTYGLPAPWFGQYAGLMKARLGVELRRVAGCDVDDGLRRRVEGYNRRMEQEIGERFGLAAHDAIQAEVSKMSGGDGP